MPSINPEFDIETEVDLDNIDEAAAKKLEERAGASKESAVEIPEVSESVDVEKPTAKSVPADTSAEPTEEELAAYSEQVRERINKLTRTRHDERREKEIAQKERDEAITFAQQALAAHRALEERVEKLSKQTATQTVEKLAAEITAAKQKYIEAANAYDTEAMADAQLQIAELVATKQRTETQTFDKPTLQTRPDVVQKPATVAPAPDKRAQEWAARNSAWFQRDQAMTALAFGVHEELVKRGIDPAADPDTYYGRLDEEIKRRFPEKFSAPRTSPVAPASRMVSGRRKVTLTDREMALIRRIGVTPEQFAAEKVKLEKLTNG